MKEDETIDDAEALKQAYEARIAEMEVKLQKSDSDKENYKKAFLSTKGKLPEEAPAPVTVTPDVPKVPEEDKYAKIERENAELKLALQNRPAANLGGEIGETKEVSDGLLSKSEAAIVQAKIDTMKRSGVKMTPEAEKQFFDNYKLRKINSI